jgi:Outer membrane protein beta-barrel domain
VTWRWRWQLIACLIATLGCGVARPAAGQVLLGYLAGGFLASENFNIGFDIGMNFTTLTGLGDASRRNAPLFGLFADWRFAEHVHLTAGLIPVSSRGAKGLAPLPLGDPVLDSLARGGTMSRTITTLDLPVIVKYAPSRLTGPRVGVGPQIAFVLDANDRYTAESPTGTAVVIEQDIEGRLANIDAGFALDLEWRWPLLAIGVRYYHGMTDLVNDNPGSPVRSRVLSGSGRIALGRKADRADRVGGPDDHVFAAPLNYSLCRGKQYATAHHHNHLPNDSGCRLRASRRRPGDATQSNRLGQSDAEPGR